MGVDVMQHFSVLFDGPANSFTMTLWEENDSLKVNIS
jgi:hypothetical protein